MTAVRRTLLEYFESHCHEQLTIEDMQRDLSASGISRSALYRNIDRMVTDGLLRRTQDSARRSSYQYIAAERCSDRIHIQCTRCGRISHIEASGERALRAALKSSDFRIDEQKTVLYGVCRNCAWEGLT